MRSLARNLAANFGGQAATTIIALVTVPLYLRLLGADGYGLVSLMLVLQGVTAILDFGLSTTASREVTAYRAQERPVADRHDLVRTLQVVYYGVALVLLVAFAIGAEWLSTVWLVGGSVPRDVVATCLAVAGATIAIRWPVALYQGILRGVEEQVVANVLSSTSNLLRGVGSVLVLWFVAPTAMVFYRAQLAFAVVELLLALYAVSRYGGAFTGGRGRFDAALLGRLGRFTVNVGGLSFFALLLKQFDKMVVSSLLPIAQLGYYNAATLASNGLGKVAQPVQGAVFPRFTHHLQRDEREALAATFHGAVQGVTFLTVPAACILVFFAADVLRLWTGDAALAAAAAPALAILAAAMLFNSVTSLAFSLLLSAGLTWAPLAMNGLGALVLAPVTIGLVRWDGITGAAYAWLAFNLVNFVVLPFVVFRRVLRVDFRVWLRRDTLPLMLLGAGLFGVARWSVDEAALAPRIVAVVVAGALYVVAGLRFAPTVRAWTHPLLGALRRRSPSS